MYKITLNSPTLGKGEVVTLAGVGELKNGSTIEVNDDVNETFRQANSYIEFDDDGTPKVVKGKTLLAAFKNDKVITVEHVKDEPSTPVVDANKDESKNEDGAVNA